MHRPRRCLHHEGDTAARKTQASIRSIPGRALEGDERHTQDPPGIEQAPRREPEGLLNVDPGGDLLSRGNIRSTIGVLGLTIVFGMGTCVSQALCPPGMLVLKQRQAALFEIST